MDEAKPAPSEVSRERTRLAGSLERRIFGRLLLLALLPPLVLLAIGTWAGAGSIGLVTTLEPWDRVAESGRALFDAAGRDSASDPTLAAAVAPMRISTASHRRG